jgi:uncharacterized protein YciI
MVNLSGGALMIRTAVILVLMLASATPAISQPQPSPSVAPSRALATAPLYLIVYQKGPSWIQGKPMHQQDLRGHLTYMQALLAAGTLVAGGPFGNGEGGMAILRTTNLKDAEAVLAEDPALLNGTFIGSVTEWTPYLDSRQTLSR